MYNRFQLPSPYVAISMVRSFCVCAVFVIVVCVFVHVCIYITICDDAGFPRCCHGC
jgi:hypothetical protein